MRARFTSVVLAVTVAAPLLALASGPAQAATNLSVGTFNVCKGGPDGTAAACAAPAPSWSVRRDRVANVVRASGVDILGLQEATNHPTPNGAKTQQDDLKTLLAPIGYVSPSFDANGATNDCKRPRDAAGQLAGPNPCENTAMLFFNAATVQQDGSAGVAMAGNIAPGLDSNPADAQQSANRSVAWAFLKKDGQDFLAISAHTATMKDATHEASRVAFANALAGWAAGKVAAEGKPADTPVVLMADLNSFDKRQPQGAQQVLRSSGWVDAFTAPVRKNIQYSTINYNADAKSGDPQGFPAKPSVTKKSKNNPQAAATRIDYIMGRNVAFSSYEVVVFLTAGGSFDAGFQGSDHQMVKATAVLS